MPVRTLVLMADQIRIYDWRWRFEQEPSEELERRLYAVGLAVMWCGDDAEYQDPGVWLEGGYQNQPAEALELLAEVAPMAEELSWMLWWPVDDADDEMLHLSLVVAGRRRGAARAGTASAAGGQPCAVRRRPVGP